MRIRGLAGVATYCCTLALLGPIACADGSHRLGKVADTSAGGGAGDSGSGNSGGVSGSSTTLSCGTPDAGWCREVIVTPKDWSVDVIVVVDGSPSMREEAREVEAALNGFAERITAAHIDVQLLLVAPHGYVPGQPAICVPPPLGSGACPPLGQDTSLPKFYHHPSASLDDQTDLPTLFSSHGSELRSLLRADAGLTLVIISDGDSPVALLESSFWIPSAWNDDKETQLSALYAFSPCAAARTEGTEYRKLADMLHGAHGDLCTESMVTGLNRVADDVIAQQACEIMLPRPYGIPNERNEFTVLDSDNVELEIVANGACGTPVRLLGPEGCDANGEGWYERPVSPEGELEQLCPATCARVLSAPDSKLTIHTGCHPL